MKRITLFFVLMITLHISLLAQTKQLKGKVTDENNQPLIGANVVEKSSGNGTQTDKSGNFAISVPDGSGNKPQLTITYKGYKPIVVNGNAGQSITIKLEKEVAALEDVVVIGYQTIKRKNLLASVSSVGARDLKDIPINSAAEALNGRLAGVTATTAEGSPDAQVRIRVRGGMSITGDNSPLYIVDGVQVENALSAISPQDIQSIDVLKDAAATAIYGARGGNGVFVITTKSGKIGRMVVTYNGFYGLKKLPNTLKVLSPYDYVIYQSERSRGNITDSTSFVKNFGTTWDTLQNYKNVSPVNWQDEIMGRTGILQTHNIAASGGNKKLTYNFGYTYNDDKAIVLNSNYKRHLFNAKVDYKLTDKIKIGLSERYTHQDVYGAGVSDDKGSSYNRLRNAVKYRPFLSKDQDIDDPDLLADPNVGNGLNLTNPILLANAEYRKKTSDVFNFTGNISINLTKHLTFRSVFGYNESKVIDRQFNDSITPYSVIQGGKKPIAGLDTVTAKTITNSNVLTYSIKDFKNKHDFDFLIGEETYDLRTKNRYNLYRDYPNFTSNNDAFEKTGLGVPFAGYPRPEETRYTSLSFFGRINYAFSSKYLVSFNLRADGSSKFALGKKWGYFPAASIAWRVKNENFMKNVNFISDLKFRAGFGTVGNNRIGDYLFLTTFRKDGAYYYGVNNQTAIGTYPSSLINPNLKWESTVNQNLGVDITLFNRVDLSVDVYKNTSKDLLLGVPIASTYGYIVQQQNIGKTSNEGIEVQLNAGIVRKPRFTWNASFNIASNKNKVVALAKNQNFFFPAASWGVNGQPTDYIVRIGDPVGSMWGLVTDGFYKVDDFTYTPSTGGYGEYILKPGVVTYATALGTVQPGAVKFKDLNGDGKVDIDNDRKIIGNPTPKFTGGLNQQFTYKQWDASIFLNFSYGNDIYNANKIELSNGFTPNSNLLDVMENRWKVVTANGQTAQYINGTTNKIIGIAPDQLAALNANAGIWQPARGTGASAFIPHSWAIEDGSFLRLNNVSIGYSIPVKTLAGIKMSKLRFYLTGNNLAILTNYTGYDPEVSVRSSALTPGLDYSAYPKSRSFIFGIQAAF